MLQIKVFLLLTLFMVSCCSSSPVGSPKASGTHQAGVGGEATNLVGKILKAPLSIPGKIKEYRATNVEKATLGKQRAENKLKQLDQNFKEAHQYAPVGNSEHNNVLDLLDQRHKAERNIKIHELTGKVFKNIHQPMNERAHHLENAKKQFQSKLEEAKSKGVVDDRHWEHHDAHIARKDVQKAEIEKHNRTIRRNSSLWPFK